MDQVTRAQQVLEGTAPFISLRGHRLRGLRQIGCVTLRLTFNASALSLTDRATRGRRRSRSLPARACA